ncbi:MAG: MarR family transcriptional regulator [Acidobacteria bacterium]|nr:MarR family transcriptional regulator [Acidobacteriota bacterium]
MSQPKGAAADAYAILSACVAGRTHKISRVIDGVFNDALRPLGIRNTQLTMLSVIAFTGSTTAAEMAPVLVMDKSTVSRNLRVMAKQGWIEWLDAPGRGRRLRLAAPGRKILKKARPRWQAAQDRARDILGDAAIESVRQIGDSVGVIPDGGEAE